MRRPLNTRQLTLPEEHRENVLALRAHAHHRPHLIHEYLKTKYPWLEFHKAWETGGIMMTSDVDLKHEIHFLVSNIDERVVIEYAGWPHFRLTI
jgi:hypothetical protein